MAFNDSQYDDLIDMYTQNQIKNKIALKERKLDIYEKIPRIQEIDQTIAGSSIDAIRAKLQHGTDKMSATKEKNHILIAEKENLLKSHGYPADYLQPIYTCPLCQDTGRVGNEYCSCFQQAAISLLYQQSNLEQILNVENFDTFDLSYYSKKKDGTQLYSAYENMSNILKAAKNFVTKFDTEGGNLLFYGPPGLGKTFLSHCIAKALLDTQHTVLYLSSIHLFDTIADAVMEKGQIPHSKETRRYIYNCDLLIIDDLGTEYTNSFVSPELYEIVNTRIREKKSTLISTNLNLDELRERYTDRIADRIFAEYTGLPFYGDNVRLAKRINVLNKNIETNI